MYIMLKKGAAYLCYNAHENSYAWHTHSTEGFCIFGAQIDSLSELSEDSWKIAVLGCLDLQTGLNLVAEQKDITLETSATKPTITLPSIAH